MYLLTLLFRNLILNYFLVFGIISFQTNPVFSQIADLEQLDKIRHDHFEKGLEYRSASVRGALNSNNPVVKRYAKALDALFLMENFKSGGDSIWISIADSTWFQDVKAKNYELLLIDDLFRIGIVSHRFMALQNILTLLYNSEFDRFYFLYSTILYQKTSNYYKFIDYQDILKRDFISNALQVRGKYSRNVWDRYKLNLVSINIANYDTIYNDTFYKTLIAVKEVIYPSIEQLVYNCSLSSYILNDTLEYKNHYTKLYDIILGQKYIPPYVLLVIYRNLELYKEMKNYLYNASFSKLYGKNVGHFVSLSLFIVDRQEYLANASKYSMSNGRYLDRVQNHVQELSSSENQNIGLTLKEIDKLIDVYYIYEPNWMRLICLNTNYNFSNFSVKGKYNDSSYKYDAFEKQFVADFQQTKQTIDRFDYLGLTKPLSGLLEFYHISNYFYETPDYVISSDTSLNQTLQKLFDLYAYLIRVEYLFKGYLTFEKSIMMKDLSNISTYFSQILLRKYDIRKYNYLFKFSDPPAALIDFDPILLNIETRERYLSFREIASPYDLKLFDSLFMSRLSKLSEVNLSEHPGYDKLFDFTKPHIKDILIDVGKRNSLNDSTLIAHLSANDILAKSLEELSLDEDLFYFDDSSHQGLRAYSNTAFCIDNSNLKILYSDTSRNIGIEKYLSKRADTTANILWYLLLENYQIRDITRESSQNFLYKRKYDLYACFSNSSNNRLIRLCGLDTLKSLLDYRYPSSESFITKIYFDEIDRHSKALYRLLLLPIDKYVDPKITIKLILPSELVTVPIEYIYAKEKLVIPKLIEYSSLYRALFKSETVNISLSDTTAIFSEMVYNNIYCNINKKWSQDSRGGVSELKYSQTERLNIEKYTTHKRFLKHDANKNNFINTLLDKNIKNVHLITHGIYIPNAKTQIEKLGDNEAFLQASKDVENPLERQLLLFSSDSIHDNSKNNLLTAWETRYLWDLSHLNLIFLSACETGLIEEDYPKTSGYQGFINNFLERGVKSVIVSRWKVDDRYASDFSSKFYQYLSHEKSYTQAFYKTKNFFYKNGSPPQLWSSFVLIQ
jgi:CHAT domain-containing protein